jgi:SAM-dependent methyltransferase
MNYRDYSLYLRRPSFLGNIYRKYFLYPKLKQILSGVVLDLGCGLGRFIDFRPETLGVDINPYNVEYCKKQGHNVQLMVKNSIPFPDQSFDCILMDNVLEHIECPQIIIKEIVRTLRNQGKLVVGVPGVKGYAYDPDHKIFYNKDQLSRLLSSEGFELVSHFYTPIKSEFLDRQMRQYCFFGVFQLNQLVH